MRARLLIPICFAVACGTVDADTSEVVVEIIVPGGGKAKDDKGDCASGCSLKKHPVPHFTTELFTEALAAYAEAPVDQESEALDTLLFYGTRTEELIESYGTGPLSAAHRAFLTRELTRRFAYTEIRMVEPDGNIRASVSQRVPIAIKQHLHAEVKDLQPLEFNGTVMRVGLNTVWSRY